MWGISRVFSFPILNASLNALFFNWCWELIKGVVEKKSFANVGCTWQTIHDYTNVFFWHIYVLNWNWLDDIYATELCVKHKSRTKMSYHLPNGSMNCLGGRRSLYDGLRVQKALLVLQDSLIAAPVPAIFDNCPCWLISGEKCGSYHYWGAIHMSGQIH